MSTKLRNSVLAADQRLVRMLVGDPPLEEVLTGIITELESLTSGARGVAFYADETTSHLGYAAFPSFPADDFFSVAQEVPIAEDAGTAGAAAFTKSLAITTDIVRDPHWQPYRHIAAHLGFRSCWVKPLVDRDGELLGALGMYADEAREPTGLELSQLSAASNFALLAFEVLHSDTRASAAAQRRAASRYVARQYGAVRDELVTTLNHVVRTPLTSIVGFALTLTRPDVAWDSEVARTMADRLAKNASELQDILLNELDRIVGSIAPAEHLDLTSIDVDYLQPDLGMKAGTSEVALACRQAGLHLLNVLQYVGLEPGSITTHTEALEQIWPNDWVYDAWCAWHACRIALTRHGWDTAPISHDRRTTWRTSARVGDLESSSLTQIPKLRSPTTSGTRREDTPES